MQNDRPRVLPELDWSAVADLVRTAGTFVLTTHVRADTDGIGSEIALHRYLSGLGKTVHILNSEPPVQRLHFLDPDRAVRVFTAEDAELVRSADVIMVLDVNEVHRLGRLTQHVKHSRASVVVLDHHLNSVEKFAAHTVVEPRAASTGVLVYDLLLAMQARLDPVIAQALYATVVADTGSFRFSNTNARVMRVAAELLDAGADPEQVYRGVLGNYPGEKMRLLAHALGSMELEQDGRLAWVYLPRRVFEETGADQSDLEGLIEYLRLLQSVKLAVLMVETEDGRLRVSFRSENDLDVNRLAAHWGGGGHQHAAGAHLAGPVEQALHQVLEQTRKLLA
jgi:phosphoesterase RecJ-like protein